jgi:putative ABC transport system permease protein
MANSLHRDVGDTIELSGSRFKVVGIYESKMSWEEVGGVITLRDVQSFSGRPRKVMMYAVKLVDPSQSEEIAASINQQFPEVHASLASDFVEQMPDMKTMDGMIGGISFISILIGGIGVLNTMLMAVFERTREIGVLRALGWRRRFVMTMILKEALLLGILGGLAGVLIAFGMVYLIQKEPTMGAYFNTSWDLTVFLRAGIIALVLGLLGGAYPAYRATRLQPLEALRYE